MTQPQAPKPWVIAVVGPTATGKTALGVALAQALGSEVISADSRVVYRHLDIGTAKPTPAEMAGIPHHMLDVVPPTEAYSAVQYGEAAAPILKRLLAEGKTPVVVGGTGFYLRVLLEGHQLPEVPPDEAFRQEMHAVADAHGTEALYQRLQAEDPQRAAALYPQDRFRIIRALEIIRHTGQPIPPVGAAAQDFNVLWVGLGYDDRQALWQRIHQRVEAMLAAGWLAEVADLVARFGPEAEALRVAHGYPELVQYLAGERPLADAVTQIQTNVRQYSRRQRTWFQRNPAIHWFSMDAGPVEPWQILSLLPEPLIP